MSEASPKARSGTPPPLTARTFGFSKIGLDIPASIIPGAMAFTRIPFGPHSMAMACVMLAMAALVGPYMPTPGAGWMPLMDVKLMIWPEPLSIMAGAISRAQKQLPSRFTLTTSMKSCTDCASIAPKRTTPALFTSRSGVSPKALKAAAICSGEVTSASMPTAFSISAAVCAARSAPKSKMPMR